jgi:hypothetical protein
MAVAASDAIVGNVMLVAKGNILVAGDLYPSGERSRIDCIGSPYYAAPRQQQGRDCDFRKAIRASSK